MGSTNDSGSMTLTKDQYQNLMALLEKNTRPIHLTKGGKSYITSFNVHSNVNWILDIGATYHIFHSLDWFIKYGEINPILVNLLNENSIAVFICGTVKLSNQLIIEGVLYLPKFEVNLILVSKMCKDKDFNMVFETEKCVVQSRKDLRKIGLDKELDGLYYLEA
ncbi:hypothetical protein KIW84_012572 [Lathyrus oleraceus]|uniref:Retrovirus-related Pol polyprotein from transposon TNT 1-94-like beta-barrel domain-containing protein n=1 Tax=Pisum sativum TaxID=3888 RepID=A0A9D5BI69_PEA|nr:hypothetical protein KIW84_012572 [Pisum sativum]